MGPLGDSSVQLNTAKSNEMQNYTDCGGVELIYRRKSGYRLPMNWKILDLFLSGYFAQFWIPRLNQEKPKDRSKKFLFL